MRVPQFSKWIYVVPIAFLLVIFLFRQPIASAAMHWFAEGYCSYCLDGKLSSKRAAWLENAVQLDQPVFSSSLSIADGGHTFSAEKVLVQYSFDFWKRKVILDVFLESPRLVVGKQANQLQRLLASKGSSKNLFSLVSKVCIKNGQLVLADSLGGNLDQVIYISCEGEDTDTQQGTLEAWLDSPGQHQNSLKCCFSQAKDSSRTLEAVFRETDLSKLAALIHVFRTPLSSLQINSGCLDGDVAVLFAEGDLPQAKGVLNFKDMLFACKEAEGFIPHMRITWDEPESARSQLPQKTVGSMVLAEGASVRLTRKEQSCLDLRQLQGSAAFQNLDSLSFSFSGLCTYLGQEYILSSSGEASYPSQGLSSIDLTLNLASAYGQNKGMRLIGRGLDRNWGIVQADISHFSKSEFELLKVFSGRKLTWLENFKVGSGTLDASLAAYIDGGHVHDVIMDKVEARNLSIAVYPWDFMVYLGKSQGKVKFNFAAEHPMTTVDAEILVSNGQACLNGLDPEEWGLANINTQLKIDQGVLKRSTIDMEFSGLQGFIELDLEAPEKTAKLHFEGLLNSIGKLAPAIVRPGIMKRFQDDKLAVNAQIKACRNGVAVEGLLDLADPFLENIHTIGFGFDIEKTAENLWGAWPPSPLVRTYWPSHGSAIMQSCMPALAFPLAKVQTAWINNELGIAGLILRNGKFKAKNLPLDKFLAPFIFPHDEFHLTGIGDFEGAFDLHGMQVGYTGSRLALENHNLCAEAERLCVSPAGAFSKRQAGLHYFDFDQGRNFGVVSIENGTYFDKNSGLLFTDIKTQAILEGQKIHLLDFEAYCNDVYFGGLIDIDYSYPEPGFFDVDISVHTMNGRVPQVQGVFAHFTQSILFLQLPLDGNVSLLQPGAALRFAFNPGDFHLEASVKGALSDGSVACQNSGVQLHDLSLNFEYEHAAKTLNITDIQGSILAGKPENPEEYAISGSRVHFADCARNIGEFDLSIADTPKDKTKEIMRLAGLTCIKYAEGEREFLHFLMNRDLTHVAGLHPLQFDFALRSSSEIESFHLEAAFPLEHVMPHLKKLSRTGLMLLFQQPKGDAGNSTCPSGNFHVDLHYGPASPYFTFALQASGLQWGGLTFNKCLLNGKKKGGSWIIEQLQLDDHSLAADLVKDGNSWNFNFLGYRRGESLLVGMDGSYNQERGVFLGKVNLLEADFGKLKEWPMFSEVIVNYRPKGLMRAVGEMKIEYDPASTGWQTDARLNSSFTSLEIKGLRLKDMENISCRFIPGGKVVLNHLHSAVKSADDHLFRAFIGLERAELDFCKRELHLDNLSFKAFAEHLPALAETLQQSFPDEVTPEIADIIHHSKKWGALEGVLSLKNSLSDSRLRLSLAEGTFWYMDSEHYLNHFLLNRDAAGWRIVTQYQFQRHPFWLEIRSSSPSLADGTMVFTDRVPSEDPRAFSSETLAVEWSCHPKNGFIVKKAEGGFSGLGIKLEQDHTVPLSNSRIFLKGNVSLDVRRAANLLPEEFANTLQRWNIGRGYSLRGKWVLNKNGSRGKEGFAVFHGTLEGNDFEFKGYQFQTVRAKIDYSSKGLQARELLLQDPSGSLRIPRADLFKGSDEQWLCSIPLLEVHHFQPSLLRTYGLPQPEQGRPLLIKKLEIENLQGKVSDASSFMGDGRLDFSNKSKKMVYHPLFAIPGEILTRLGLDLAVLNPVSGHVIFNISGGKVHLTKFKDVYSEGKLSKFYLPNTPFDSYVDFDGNLHLQVRMKQYNLLFKLAELFTVTIKGSFQKPIYSLQKQPRDDHALFNEASLHK